MPSLELISDEPNAFLRKAMFTDVRLFFTAFFCKHGYRVFSPAGNSTNTLSHTGSIRPPRTDAPVPCLCQTSPGRGGTRTEADSKARLQQEDDREHGLPDTGDVVGPATGRA